MLGLVLLLANVLFVLHSLLRSTLLIAGLYFVSLAYFVLLFVTCSLKSFDFANLLNSLLGIIIHFSILLICFPVTIFGIYIRQLLVVVHS